MLAIQCYHGTVTAPSLTHPSHSVLVWCKAYCAYGYAWAAVHVCSTLNSTNSNTNVKHITAVCVPPTTGLTCACPHHPMPPHATDTRPLLKRPDHMLDHDRTSMFAWTEKDVASVVDVRGYPDEPVFCMETALMCLFWSISAYEADSTVRQGVWCAVVVA